MLNNTIYIVKVSGIKLNKIATGKIKSVELNYKKFSIYVDVLLDGLDTSEILKEPTTPLRDFLAVEDKKRGLKRRAIRLIYLNKLKKIY